MGERTAIIGAGMAGVICALDLSLSREVVLFERELHPGGRLAACRDGGLEFDCGAPYFMVTDADLRGRMEDWAADGYLARWEGWAVEIDGGNLLTREFGDVRYVGMPSMEALPAKLAALVDLRAGVDVIGLHRESDGWWLEDGFRQRHGPFGQVVCATPPAAAAGLFEPHAPALSKRMRGVSMGMRWVVMLGFDDCLSVPFDAAHLERNSLAWCGRNSSKAGRGEQETWVLIGSPEWSEVHESDSEAAVIAALSDVFAKELGLGRLSASVSRARLWRTAEPINPPGEPFLAETELGLYACGDWCLAPRVEGACLSAAALAAALEKTTD